MSLLKKQMRVTCNEEEFIRFIRKMDFNTRRILVEYLEKKSYVSVIEFKRLFEKL